MTKHKSQEPIKCYLLKIPASVHKKLVDISVKERRSLGEQIIYILEKSLGKAA